RRVEVALGALGGDARARARELDLLAFQIAELDGAGLEDPDEERSLEAEEDVLAAASTWREAAAAAHAGLTGEGAVGELLGAAAAGLRGRGGSSPFSALADRLQAVGAEVADIAAELRDAGEAIAA